MIRRVDLSDIPLLLLSRYDRLKVVLVVIVLVDLVCEDALDARQERLLVRYTLVRHAAADRDGEILDDLHERVARDELVLEPEWGAEQADELRQLFDGNELVGVRVENVPDFNELPKLLHRHDRAVALRQLVEVLQDYSCEELHHDVGTKQLPQDVVDGACKSTSTPIAKIVAIALVARFVHVVCRTVVHDLVPSLSCRLSM
mmetsp:Transcript_55293/g.113095  ORF Transcript_55293/g.113095 Transcript_55293/m.113095 type:complete len:202 (-) Transcript_55293:1104-1709(-)